MKFHIPFTISSIDKLKKKKILIRALIKHKKNSRLEFYLKNSDAGIETEQYQNVVIRTFVSSFIVFYMMLTTLFGFIGLSYFYLLSLLISVFMSGFVMFSQKLYPKIYFSRREKDIERNLVAALEDMIVQLSSGIPLYNIMVNISYSSYGELGIEFKKAVKKINAGVPQVEVIEEMGEKNPSPLLRRALWQISNGMKAGSDISIVIRDSIKLLNQEQIVQIQNYGNKLNPLIMFYMLVTIILPALAITFLTIISSMINLGKNLTMITYVSLFVFVILIQVMFLGAIRSARPTLV